MMEQPIVQLFGIIPTSLPCLVTPTSAPSQTSYVYNLPIPPNHKPFSHITVFLLPGVTLPANTAAAVYLSLPTRPGDFKFLGGIGEGKESAVFKISGLLGNDGDMSAFGTSVTVGISVETAESVASQMAAIQEQTSATANTSSALTLATKVGGQAGKVDTAMLAQKIIKNAFNFLASFSGNIDGGVEVIPLKAFEDWWKKFEGRIRTDPGFLERDGD